MELWVNEFWLFITAVVFTIVGLWMSKRNSVNIIEQTIDALIEQGYLKAIPSKTGNDVDLIRWEDWNKKQHDQTTG